LALGSCVDFFDAIDGGAFLEVLFIFTPLVLFSDDSSEIVSFFAKMVRFLIFLRNET